MTFNWKHRVGAFALSIAMLTSTGSVMAVAKEVPKSGPVKAKKQTAAQRKVRNGLETCASYIINKYGKRVCSNNPPIDKKD